QMPAEINYDLGDVKQIDSIRTSFYKWESSRMYQYSVYVSEDSLNWQPVIEEIWSENIEWSEISFETTEARYIRLVLMESSQGAFASLWEIETYGPESVTGISNEETVPEKFELMQNYPNPFNPSTRISWQSAVDSR